MFKIYTKEDCIFCFKAKKLLDTRHYEEIKIENSEQAKDLKVNVLGLPEDSRITLPKIFYNGKLIGGFTELELFLKPDEVSTNYLGS